MQTRRKPVVIAHADDRVEDLGRARALENDEAFTREVRDANPLCCHLACFRKSDHQRLSKKQAGLIRRTSVRRRRTRETNVNLFLIKRQVLAARNIFEKTESNPWIASFIFSQKVRKKWRAGKSHKADTQPSKFSFCCSLCCCDGPRRLCQGFERFLVERFALRREPYCSSFS